MDTIFPEIEKRIIEFWKKEKIFEQSLDKKGGDFVFYEGPPTANGRPGIHHVLARAFKDIICRYQTMKGKRVLRKAGWDVHGLPVELEVEKSLGLKDKKAIEEYGIAKFNEKCRESVWKYAKDWEDLTERMGYWLDLDDPYITSDPKYMETVFFIIKQLWDKELLYKGYKVVPYCPRCGTGLSSHELAQGYKNITEPAIYIKYELEDGNKLLVWTTTPWTLPANVAIAVNPKIDYVLAEIGKEKLILAKKRLEILDDYKILKEFKGKELVGLQYKSLFSEEKYKTVAGDFVNTEEGTGLVHIAPAFGQDDMALAQKHDLPILLTVDEQGKFNTTQWKGKFVKDADPLITEYLQTSGCLFKTEQYQHDYPFCWRCSTPLLYYAKKSWFIKATDKKDELLKNNQKINWIPEHIKEGRFGEWLNELKDWALSRERYWGTPLPIWQCQKCEHQITIGSREDLRKQKFSNNNYFLLRHGEAESNAQEFLSCYPEVKENPLTEKGKKQVQKTAKALKNIDIIVSSDVLRTKMTAEIVAKELNLEITYDERLREVSFGELNGKPVDEIGKIFNLDGLTDEEAVKIRFVESFPNGESWANIRNRTQSFIQEIDKKYEAKNILIVSHQLPLTLLESSSQGEMINELADRREKKLLMKTAESREMEFNRFPYNPQGELDWHRPFIDEIEFDCPKCKDKMKRVEEVIDCWFDSGSMPFAQRPWASKKPPQFFPADYIAEAVDQTRGWFYTLLAISTLLGFGLSYKNVISLGLVLDEKGQKMSKSKGNIVDPWEMMDKYGADTLRWYLFTVNQPSDSKLFTEKDLDISMKKFLMTYYNCYKFLDFHKDKASKGVKSDDLLDKWILSKLNNLILKVTKDLDGFHVTPASRSIEEFVINDLSLWYIRRSRKRHDFEKAYSTLNHVLITVSQLAAPFIPFVTEEVYQNLSKDKSVHLSDWPKANKKLINEKLEKNMEMVKNIVGLSHKLRSDAAIRVRQPLSKLEVIGLEKGFSKKLLKLIEQEVNVEEVGIVTKITPGLITGKDIDIEVGLDTKITEDLKRQGMIREITRSVQQLRKEANYKPKDKIVVYAAGLGDFLGQNKKELLQEIKAQDIVLEKKDAIDISKEFKIGDQTLWLGLKLV